MSKFDPYEDIEPEHEEVEEEEENPYVAPRVQSSKLKPLGSLAQSARGKELNSARTILIVIGVLTIAANAFLLYNLPNEMEQGVQNAAQGGQLDPANAEQTRQMIHAAGIMFYGGALALGIVFVVFGIIVKMFPVPITILSLVLYILAAVVFAIFNPLSLVSGAIMKIIVVVALARAIKAAFAYEQDKREGFA